VHRNKKKPDHKALFMYKSEGIIIKYSRRKALGLKEVKN